MASASVNQRYCSLCPEDHENEVAIVWYPECHDALCSNCYTYHKWSKFAKHHVIISIEDFEKLSEFLQSQPDFCRDHECLFDLYCKKHEAPCCVKCVPEYYSYCCSSKETSSLMDVIKNIKLSAKLETNETLCKLVITIPWIITLCLISRTYRHKFLTACQISKRCDQHSKNTSTPLKAIYKNSYTLRNQK